MTRVKVCGITTRPDLNAAIDAGVDAIGLIVDVDVDTPREIDAGLAVELARQVPPFVSTVLVTMPDAPETTVDLVDRIKPDVVQVHGDLTPGDLAYLSANVNGGVVKAVDAADAKRYEPVADAMLVDSLDESGAGGTGETHDWIRTRDAVADLDTPIVLAGGLTPENVARAIETVDPYAVDVASGVEDQPGRKDSKAISAFVRAAGGSP
ncbi:MAG: phosphoribosylanthranilate isomerase [Natronomonas sp.]